MTGGLVARATGAEAGVGGLRLFLSDSQDSFVDVPTEEILEIEPDSVAPTALSPEVAPKPGRQAVDLDEA